jgi:hypothetical protein
MYPSVVTDAFRPPLALSAFPNGVATNSNIAVRVLKRVSSGHQTAVNRCFEVVLVRISPLSRRNSALQPSPRYAVIASEAKTRQFD